MHWRTCFPSSTEVVWLYCNVMWTLNTTCGEHVLSGQRITFRYQGEGELYGNNVQLRPAYLPTSANRSWIDINHPLPTGVIERYFIYVHNVTSLDPQSRRISLQLWRPIDITVLKTFRLVWMQLVQVLRPGHDIGAMYSVRTSVVMAFLNSVHLI